MAAAQADLAKELVGTWQGELQQRTKKGADPGLTLIIKSVKQEDGKWVTDARLGRGEGGKTAKVHIKELVGTAVLTTSQAGGKGARDRSVKFEKKE